MARTLISLFIFGALIGNCYNSFHAFSGTIPVTATHINPLLDWSSYLLFGFAGVSIGFCTLLFDKLFGGTIPKPSTLSATRATLLLGLFYFLSACMFLSNTVILLILIAGFVLSVFLYDRRVSALLAALLVAIAGTSVEITLVHYNVYYYARPQFMGVAWWLPFLYGIASLTTGHLARALNSRKTAR